MVLIKGKKFLFTNKKEEAIGSIFSVFAFSFQRILGT